MRIEAFCLVDCLDAQLTLIVGGSIVENFVGLHERLATVLYTCFFGRCGTAVHELVVGVHVSGGVSGV